MDASASAQRQAVINRVKRAQGQLAGVLRMIEEDRELDAVLHQLKAVSSALNRAGFAMVAGEWREASRAEDDWNADTLDRLEKLFLSLS